MNVDRIYLAGGIVLILVLYAEDPKLAGMLTVFLALVWAGKVYAKGGGTTP